MSAFNKFTRLYPTAKTIRLTLKPIGKTLKHIISSGILDEDKHRADSYKEVKKIIDEYHKAFIDSVLSSCKLPYDSEGKKNSLAEFLLYYNMRVKDKREKDYFKTIQRNLCKYISDKLLEDKRFKRIDKKELIQQDLIAFIETMPDKDKKQALIKEFWNFTTYFSGYHENRKNMYAAEEKSTAISYRLINDNLPRFIDNMNVFSKLITKDLSKELTQLYSDFEEYLNVAKIEDLFCLDYFNTVLTQKQIDVYNAIIGGKSLDNDVKIKGLNEYINLYNQHHKDAKLPKLKLLFKQILSDRNKISWLPEEFTSDNQTLQAIKSCYENLCVHILGDSSLKTLLKSLGDYDLNGIFIRNDQQLTDISQKIFGNWSVISRAIQTNVETNNLIKKRESFEAYQERISKIIKSYDSFSLAYINDCLHEVGVPIEIGIEHYFGNLGAVDNENEQTENLFARISNAYEDVRNLLDNPYSKDCNLSQDKKNVERIKLLLDAIKDLQHFVKPLCGKGDEPDKDERFYGEFSLLWSELDQITPLYNKVRNRMTQKPYSEDKIKLNFKNPTLLDNVGDPSVSSAVIFRGNENLYYLAILNNTNRQCLNEIVPPKDNDDIIEKMIYLSGGKMAYNIPNLMEINGKVQKVNGRKEKDGENMGQNIRLENAKNNYLPKPINAIRKKKSYLSSSDNFNSDDLKSFIEY